MMKSMQLKKVALAVALALAGLAPAAQAQQASGAAAPDTAAPLNQATPNQAPPNSAPSNPAPSSPAEVPPVPAKPTANSAAASTTAPAAGGSTAQLEEVLVTGIRASRQQSLSKKRESDSLVDVVTAEDIGKLPDHNVADALQRVPGVNISSGSGGEGGFSENDRVSIRGTNPSLTQTTVNGHMIATGDWYIGDQTNTVGRSVSFTLLPAEIVGSVVVQKSSEADYIEGGTVGNVDIVTRKPLDFKKTWTFEATAQALYADLPDKVDPQVNALINWKNDNDTLGALFQLFSEARHERRDGQELFLLGEGQIGTVASGDPVAVAHPNLANVVYPAQIGSAAFTQHSDRQGGLIDLQAKPLAGLTLDLNGFYSHFLGTNFDTNFMASPLNELQAGVSPTSYKVVNGTLVSATFPNEPFNYSNPGGSAFPGVRDSIYRPLAGSSTAFLDLTGKYKASESLLLSFQIGSTQGVGVTPHDYGYEAYLINSPLSYQMNGTSAPAQVSFPGVNTTNFNNPTNVTNGGSWSDSVKVSDREKYAQVDALWTVDQGILESVKYGLRYAEHERSDFGVNYGCSLNPNDPCYTNPDQVFPPPHWNGTTSPGNFGTGIGFGPGYLSHFWVMDPNAIQSWETAYNGVNTGPAYQGNFVVQERDTAGYAMANLAGQGWRGNAGLRLVNTGQLSSSWNPSSTLVDQYGNPIFLPVSVAHDYFYALPSANLKWDLSPTLVGRLAASETMSRADYSALSPAVTLNNLDLTGSGGNANIKPIRSINTDAALEWYFAPQAILSVALYVMNMPSYVTYGYNTQSLLDTQYNAFRNFIVTSPFNVGAHNEGYEVAWQQPLWGNFGALLNYTYSNGHSDDGTDLVGSSRNTVNMEAYYEDKVFSARLAYTYRSSFLVGLANVTQQYEAGIGTLAASLNYKINETFTITLEGLNLNDPVLKYYTNPQQPQAFYTNGRQYYLGVRMSL